MLVTVVCFGQKEEKKTLKYFKKETKSLQAIVKNIDFNEINCNKSSMYKEEDLNDSTKYSIEYEKYWHNEEIQKAVIIYKFASTDKKIVEEFFFKDNQLIYFKAREFKSGNESVKIDIWFRNDTGLSFWIINDKPCTPPEDVVKIILYQIKMDMKKLAAESF